MIPEIPSASSAARRPLTCGQRAALLLFLAPLLLWQGYCWGVVLQSSSFMQRLFQCSCPPAREAARFPTRHGIQDQDTLELFQPVPAYFLHLEPRFSPRYWVADGSAVLFIRPTATVGDLGPTIAAVILWFAVEQLLLLLTVPE